MPRAKKKREREESEESSDSPSGSDESLRPAKRRRVEEEEIPAKWREMASVQRRKPLSKAIVPILEPAYGPEELVTRQSLAHKEPKSEHQVLLLQETLVVAESGALQAEEKPVNRRGAKRTTNKRAEPTRKSERISKLDEKAIVKEERRGERKPAPRRKAVGAKVTKKGKK